MREFLRNFAILAMIAVAIFILFRDTVRQMVEVYRGLGILPVVIVLMILAALPRNSKRRRR